MDYKLSTSHACLMSPAELSQLRSLVLAAADGSPVSTPRCLIGIPPPTLPSSPPSSPLLDVGEEATLVTFYAAMIRPLCGKEAGQRRRPEKVADTAHQFLKRFYLSNSVVHFNPLKIMVASVFLASKVEDLTISATSLSEGTKEKNKEVSVEDIVKHELLLLSGLGFQIHCHHSFRPLMGFVNDLQRYATSEGGILSSTDTKEDALDVSPLYKTCRSKLEELTFSDMVLLHSPGMLAAAALALGLESLKIGKKKDGEKKGWEAVDVMAYFEKTFVGTRTEEEITKFNEDLKLTIEQGRGIGAEGSTLNCALIKLDVPTVKAVYKKLKKVKMWDVGAEEGG
eukprot:CAMPEP_0118632762 /NCGR_PEP_ID=MMETSP0785-20121206/624_1 /TAXON_ID=91992 /ORGANISM="Bolidomonas pacifica, Strain CCMP 1866" /LENGTH=339 /DNA_ID=CAMNT_0006523567 /DNA_START=74 /DNA_END=1090 /DNA_ORIENTATION=-